LNSKFLAEFGTAPSYEFITTDTEISNFFSSGITTTPPRMIWIPDDWGRSSSINQLFTTNAEKIADFVNSGGGLFSSYNNYGWLTALLPSATFNDGGCNGGPEATVDGAADFGLTNNIVAACWHGYFTGNVGTLKVLVDYPYPTPTDSRKAVSIGGGEVSLPSSFTLSVSPENPEAGQDIVITALAQTISGVPQSGVVVTVAVSSGPDSGQTFSATTDSSGIARITLRTNTSGSAVYTATAVVNGVSKTVSATVSWQEPSTTTSPSTTEVVETTAPTTTAVLNASPEESSTTTTIHDHSTHSHGSLPTTGMSVFQKILLSTLLMLIGVYFQKMSKKEAL
jgi:hypothetical protein